MHRISLFVLLLLIGAVAACGCTGTTNIPPQPAPTTVPTTLPTTVPVPTVPPGLGGKWVLQTMAIQQGSVPLTPTTEISLYFTDGTSASGWGGCNNYFTTYTLTGAQTPKGNGITFGPVSSTKMHCQTTSSQETTYLQTLQNTAAYSLNGNQLVLTDSSQNALVFKLGSSVTSTPYYPEPA